MRPKLGEAFADAALDDVLQVDHAQKAAPSRATAERRAAGLGDIGGDRLDLAQRFSAETDWSTCTAPEGIAVADEALTKGENRNRPPPLRDGTAFHVDAAHPALCRGKARKWALSVAIVAGRRDAVLLLGRSTDDRAALPARLVGQAKQACAAVGEIPWAVMPRTGRNSDALAVCRG